MGLDKKTIQLVEKRATESIQKLRAVAEKEFAKLLKQAEKATDPVRRRTYFDRAVNIARRTEQVVSEMETQVAAIKNPWHATAGRRKKRKS